MREIKFRAWDKDSKKMWEPDFIRNGEPGLTGPGKKQITIYPSCPLMQFTGLLDSTGKEIYEGDILKYVGHICSGCGQSIENPKDSPYVVKWNQEQLCFECLNADENWMHPTIWRRDMAIIGNVYENPELIEPKQ